MAPNQTSVLSAQAIDAQFDSTRIQTKVYAGKSKKINPTTPTITEEDIFEEKFKKEFPEYVERKKEKYTWKQFYQKRMDKKQKKQEEKLNKLTMRIGKTSALQQKSAPKTKMIDIPSKLRPLSTNQASQKNRTTIPANTAPVTKPRQVIAPLQGPTQIRRVPPAAVARTFTQNGASTKKTTPLMRKCLQMMKK
ncbi:hypothetical protein CRE_04339 [Caenorhabditis remanei]|uniref:Uncharacterized protein n=1 Tax=Caenorhabditis remanei TaxID=31234 RepID=E3NGS0_CAERE|nr:hypothetical protein CRE_04339 [Caenorhabditis remanei]